MEMKKVKSSNISAIGYDIESKKLRVRFSNGSEYDYEEVSQETFVAFISASSTGRYYHQNIKNKFTSAKIEGNDDE